MESNELASILTAVRRDVSEASGTCPTRTVLDHVLGKWGVLVLLELADSPCRWGVLRRQVGGISEKMLAQTLRTLTADGLVRRHALPVVPPHVEYSLSERGTELVAALLPLMGWVTRNATAIVAEAADPSATPRP